MICELEDKIFSTGTSGFTALALDIFRYQYDHNPVYRTYADAIGKKRDAVEQVADIPFLPISFFKTHDIVTGSFVPEAVFESSGTTNTGNSRHLVRSLDLYRRSFKQAFELFYGDPAGWCIAALLPAYLERQHSSLVVMADELITSSQDPNSAFYLYDHRSLAQLIRGKAAAGKRTLLIGVTFALLDFAETFPFDMKNTVVMETGGMKGRRKEITREEVHEVLKQRWQLDAIHSEYGMTEMLSQAYSMGGGIFSCPLWMKIVMREEDDPLSVKKISGQTQEGLVNVIDLANIYSCSFIATDDLGKLYPDGRFEISGRMDASDMRGCSQMYL